MVTKQRIIDSQEVRSRAAEIRRRWSPTEKRRRTGLPPDIPARLREFISGVRQPAWSTVSGRSCRGAALGRPFVR